MKFLERMASLLLLIPILCMGVLFNGVEANAATIDEKTNESSQIQPRNGVTEWYRSYCYSAYGKYLGFKDEYWNGDAYDIIWQTSGSWKGYVLNNRDGYNVVTNCNGIVLSSESGYYPINIHFDKDYYVLSIYDDGKNNKEFVKGVQQSLKWLGYNIGSSGIDGIYGYNTEQAVISFQRNHGLDQDGIVGKVTYFNLAKANY